MKTDTATVLHHTRQIKKVTWIGLVLNLLLSTAKAVVGHLAHSQALVADAIHSLSDLSTDIAVLLGAKYWTAPADSGHPYGHYRIEAMISLLIGLVLAGAAIMLGYDALASLRIRHAASPSWVAFWIAVTSIVVKEGLYRYTALVGLRLRSSAVQANALHHRSDALSSIPVALAVLVSIIFPSWSFVDHAGALVVTVFILFSAWQIVRPALEELSDRGACHKTQELIRQTTLQTPGVNSLHALRSRRCGPGFFVDLHIQVNPELTVHDGHRIASEVKRRLFDTNSDISDVLVHVEPSTAETPPCPS